MRSTAKKAKNTGHKMLAAALIVAMFALGAVIFFITHAMQKNKDNNLTDAPNAFIMAASQSISQAADTSLSLAHRIYEGQITLADINFEAVFKDCIMLGDSITSGLSAYGFLSESIVYCRIGGSVLNSDEMVKKAAEAAPPLAFFSYGTNDLGMFSGDAELFVERYREIIEKFRAISPKTKIYVNSIPKPSDTKIASGGYFYKWEEFNSKVQQMCSEIGAEYIDNTEILRENPQLYAGDGIHVSPSYYPLWMARMAQAAGLQWLILS